MMKIGNWKMRLSALLATLLILLTGCEAVQGYEIGQALQNEFTATSKESAGTLSIELLPGDTTSLTEKEKAMFAILRNMKINIKDAKMQDRNHASVKADFTYNRGTIPFQITIDNDEMIVNIEGSNKPIVIHNSNPIEAMMTESIIKDLQKKMKELIPSVAKFNISHAPNPKTISISQVTEQIHNETLNLQKLHAEIYGSEWEGLLTKFITNILADEKGLKELIGQMYDALMPTVKFALKTSQEQMNQMAPDSPSISTRGTNPIDVVIAYLDNKTLVVEFGFTTIQQALKAALKEFDHNMKDSAVSKAGPKMGNLLTDKTYLKLDLFIDSDKQIRKTNYDLQINLEGSKGPLSSIKITGASESWNINKPVTSDKIDLSGGSLEVDPSSSFKGYMFLNSLDKNSLFYKLLKDDLHVTRKTIKLTPVADRDNPYQFELPFVNKDGVTMVPARYVAEQFGAEVQWNKELQLLTLIDGATGNPIVLTIGNHTAHVNGAEVSLESPAIIRNGSTYVPLRFITEALGAKLDWNENTNTATITHE